MINSWQKSALVFSMFFICTRPFAKEKLDSTEPTLSKKSGSAQYPGSSRAVHSIHEWRLRISKLADSNLSREDIARSILIFQSDLEKQIDRWSKMPASDEQFLIESDLREIFYLSEPLFKVALNPSDKKSCEEQKISLEMDSNAGMPESKNRES